MTDPDRASHLYDLPVSDYLDALAAATPTPGGGSASAVSGAMAAALVAMVARLALARPGKAGPAAGLEAAAERASTLQTALRELADADARAYEEVLAAYRMPKDTPEQKTERATAIQTALIQAAETPLEVARACTEVLHLAVVAATNGLPSARSDAAVAALLAHAGLRGAALNVTVNLELITDAAFNRRADETLDTLMLSGQRALAQALAALSPGD